MLEEQLADMINETWDKFKMDHRIEETRHDLQKEIDKLKSEFPKNCRFSRLVKLFLAVCNLHKTAFYPLESIGQYF